MQRNTRLEVMFPLIRLKHRQLESIRSPQFAMRPGDPQHELWHEMQAAYYKYLFVSQAQNIVLEKTIEDKDSRISVSTAERLKAFEDYVDTRFKFSEFRFGATTKDPIAEVRPSAEGNTEALRLVEGILATIQTFLAIARFERNKSQATRSLQRVHRSLNMVRMTISHVSGTDQDRIYEQLGQLERSAADLRKAIQDRHDAEEPIWVWSLL